MIMEKKDHILPTKATKRAHTVPKKTPWIVVFIGFIGIIVFCSLGSSLFAEEGQYYGSPDILKYPFGVKNTTVGGANVAIAEDPFSSFANPAGLLNINFINVALGYHLLPTDNHLGYFSSVFPRLGTKNNMVVGLSGAYHTMVLGDAKRSASSTTGTKLSNYQILGIGSFGVRLGNDPKGGTLFGVNLKFVQHMLDDNQGWAMGADIGLIQVKLIPFIDIGLTISDLMVYMYQPQSQLKMVNPTLKISVGTSSMDWGRVAIQVDKNLLTRDMIKFHIGGYFMMYSKMKSGNNKDFNKLPAGIFDDSPSSKSPSTKKKTAKGEIPPDLQKYKEQRDLYLSKYQTALWLMGGYNVNRFTFGVSSILFSVLSLEAGVLFPNEIDDEFGYTFNTGVFF